MATTTRLSLRYPTLSDTADVPRDIGNLASDIDKAAIFSKGTLANRPTSTVGSPGIDGRYYLATDTSQLFLDTGTSWVEVSIGAGAIVQVVEGSTSSLTTITSTASYSDTGLSATITPKSASNTILVIVAQACLIERQSNVAIRGYIRIARGSSTSVVDFNRSMHSDHGTGSSGYNSHGWMGIYTALDSPATTSAVTYKTQGKINDASNNGGLYCQLDSAFSRMTLLEVRG